MKHTFRNWHTWISLALGLPLLLVGLTAIFIAHEKSLGTKEIVLPFGGKGEEMVDIRASTAINGKQWLATRYGVFLVNNGLAQALTGGPKDEIRSIQSTTDGNALIAGKKGLWQYTNGESQQVFKGDCWHVTRDGNGFTASCKYAGLLSSVNGQQWSETPITFPEGLSSMKEMTLANLMMDIHTGKLFFGKDGEWIWIDVLGAVIILLSLTGFVMWMRSRRTRSDI